MKHIFYSLLAACGIFCIVSCASSKVVPAEQTDDIGEVTAPNNMGADFYSIYVPEEDEMQYFLSSYTYLSGIDAGEYELPDDLISQIYEYHLYSEDFSSMLFRQYLLATENEAVKKQFLEYKEQNNLSDDFSKCLEKKYKSEKRSIGENAFQYSYNDSEFNEDIDLFSIKEVHPLDDEFGILLFNNNWNIFSLKSTETNEPIDKKIILMCGGGTNCLTVTFNEFENINSEKELKDAMNLPYYENKFENWQFTEVPLVGILERSGASNFYLGFGTGPDIIKEISCASANAYIYNKKLKKLYVVTYFMNFSKINMYYSIKEDLYNYMSFFALTSFCE